MVYFHRAAQLHWKRAMPSHISLQHAFLLHAIFTGNIKPSFMGNYNYPLLDILLLSCFRKANYLLPPHLLLHSIFKLNEVPLSVSIAAT